MMRSVTHTITSHVTERCDWPQLLPPVFSGGGGKETWEASVWDAPTLGEWESPKQIPETKLAKNNSGLQL